MSDSLWMNVALSLARAAKRLGEVPVGAAVVRNDALLATGLNLRELRQDVTAHAELIALAAAQERLQSWRLQDCEVFVTLEPCLMCAGALIQARVKRVIYATKDPKAGALGSLYSLHDDDRLNHRLRISTGTLEQESSQLLKEFFRQRRV